MTFLCPKYLFGLIFLLHLARIESASDEERNLRLPSSLRPLHYAIQLKPFLEDKFHIEGHVQITFEVVQSTQQIVLHIKDIITHNDSLQIISSLLEKPISIKNQTYDCQRDFYIVNLEEPMKTGATYELKLSFTGSLSSDLEGFYKTSYINTQGKRIWVAVTQFQPISARKAFPCFDEPHFKTTFKVFLGRRENMTAISNMPLKQTISRESGWVTDEFETTVLMPTYLLAFVICDFPYIEVTDVELLKTKIKLWSRESLIEKTEFAREISTKGLMYLENFFNLSFPLPKLDMVAVPEMSSNAMENWGLIISRESGLLYNLQFGTDDQMRWVSYLIAHELAHQWFGNIVTMKWWTDLWLNEGFATYIGYRVVDQLKPELKVLDWFVVKTLQKVMKLDALKSAPSVRIKVEDPQQIKEIFGEITYSKGASIIRMMKYFLGEATFRRGLNKYLNDLKYKSAEQDDLWKYLTEAAHYDEVLPPDLTLKSIMETWTSQPGFPVISVSRNDSVKLKQEPFRLTQSDNDLLEDKRKWFVPITWITEDTPQIYNKVSYAWFRPDQVEITINKDNQTPDKWIILNPKQTGFYRVNYDSVTWSNLIRQLRSNHTVIDVVTKSQLLDDALNLARAGYLDYNTAMSVTSYLRQETEFIPWLAALNNFGYLDKMLRTTSVYGAFKNYVLSVISPLYDSMGIEDEETDSSLVKALRKEVVSWACHLGQQNCTQTAMKLMNLWMHESSKPCPIQRNLAPPFYCAAVRIGNETVWNFLWERYQDQTEDPGHRRIIITALGCSKELWIIARYLKAAFRPDWGVTRQDAPLVYQAVAKTSVGSLLAWNYLKENWMTVKDTVGPTMFALPYLVKSVTNNFNTKQHLEELNWFTKRYEGNFGPAEWAFHQSLESTVASVDWLSANLDTIQSWLQERGFDSSLKVNY